MEVARLIHYRWSSTEEPQEVSERLVGLIERECRRKFGVGRLVPVRFEKWRLSRTMDDCASCRKNARETLWSHDNFQ